MSTSVGSIHYDLKLDTTKFDVASANINKKVNTLSDKFTDFGKSVVNSSVKATAGIAAVSAILSPFVRDAVKRVDTLNNFPKVMSNMGISAEDASVSTKMLVDKLKGLPTTLDTATLSVQRLTTKTQDVKKSTDIFLALNNAIIAGGAPMELQTSAAEQFAQAFSKGKPDMMEWRSILAAMPAQLNQVAKSMNLTSVDELGEKLRDGTISMQEFADEIIKLNSSGVGGLPNFEQQAKNATNGIGTSFANMKTAIVRGIANIIQSIGAANIADKINKIGESLEKVFKFIADNTAPIAVFIGTILTIAFAKLAVAVAMATWPVLLVASLFTGLYLLYQRFEPQIQAVISAFKDKLAPAINFVTEKAKEIYNWFMSYLMPIFRVIWSFVVNQLKSAFEDLKNAFNRIKEAVEPFMPQLQRLAQILGIVALVIAGIVIGTIFAFITAFTIAIGVISRVIGWISQLISWMFHLGSSAWHAMNNVRNAIFGVFSGAWNWLYNAGRSIIDGLINGIRDKIGGAVSAAKDVVSRVRNLFPFSPAKEGPFSGKGWTLYSGQSIMEGLADGINKAGNIPQMAMDKALSGINTDLNVNAQALSSPVKTSEETTNNIYGNITLSDQSAVDRFFDRLSRNNELTQKGLTTI